MATNGPTKNILVDVWLIATLATSAVDEVLADVPLSVDEFAVYGLIADLSPVTAADLVRATGLPPTTLSGILTRCERRGELERVSNAADRRSAVLRLTEHGLAVYRASLPGLLDLLARLDDAIVDGSDTVRLALQVLDDAFREVRGGSPRPYRLAPPSQRPVVEYDGAPLTPVQQREVRRYVDWMRHRDGGGPT
jgi:DNA-binding MarR family transcriptional regulator